MIVSATEANECGVPVRQTGFRWIVRYVPGSIGGGVVFRRRIPVPARVALVDLLRVIFLAQRTTLHGLKLLDWHPNGSLPFITLEFG